tara:strand:+ start:2765 stop:3013 length:249 start_codon:yes stop_codon:yes gene_type:complete
MRVKHVDKKLTILYIILCIISGYTLIDITLEIHTAFVFSKIILFIICSIVFSYGIVSLIEDFKSGGISKIIKRIKGDKNDRD